MMILQCMVVIIAALFSQLPSSHAQGGNACTNAAINLCNPYPCVQIGNAPQCLCNGGTVAPSAAACNGGVITTQSPIIFPNQCGNAICPANAECIPTNQNPSQYVCVCATNVLANPDCPLVPLPNNPCDRANPCQAGSRCVANPITLQPVCICRTGTYGQNCGYPCRTGCDINWCYNGGRCTNAYGQPYCSCGLNYRGRRCELRYNSQNYVYLYYNPGSRW
ncbi:unnamed protein product [Rotaria socialis]|uniref:EGF-like domain-containing protein n=1 Tax=Rotaria socialis TaxID=392032 RepID=A0A819Z8Y3_9BILA|nr:unnamed protein product [Rotaria socialis]CAF3395138.1 unnamed protein product [Rotaria socialis]CAF3406472.1 unnamed protein product [Rotaria socialis]CAF3673845.1 unnamed protein product [Rotaria socialis]CAF4160027.1 unnamed protein product [Rotaria socialis]